MKRCRRWALLYWVVLALVVMSACEDELAHQAPAAAETKSDTGHERHRKIIAFGDSLTSGLGLALDEAYPAQLQKILDAEGLPFEVINAGVSGETTAGGLRRIGWVLDGHDAAVVIVALGGNDGLRGLPAADMKANLKAILDEVRGRGIQALLAAILPPSDHGDPYSLEFTSVFPELALELQVPLIPFLLEDVVGVRALNQPDGIHPNVEGAGIVAGNVFRYLEPLLSEASVESAVE